MRGLGLQLGNDDARNLFVLLLRAFVIGDTGHLEDRSRMCSGMKKRQWKNIMGRCRGRSPKS